MKLGAHLGNFTLPGGPGRFASGRRARSCVTLRPRRRDHRAVLAPSTTAGEDRSGLTLEVGDGAENRLHVRVCHPGDDDEEFWRNAEGHMGVLHPELVGNVTREDILAQAEQF
jgi:hypothetical protein